MYSAAVSVDFFSRCNCGSRRCAHKGISHAANLSFFFSPLFSPQALQPYTEKAGCAQGAGQRAELPVYCRQNTGGWVNLMCAAGSVAEHLTAECVTACRFSLYFSIFLSLSQSLSLSLSLTARSCASLNTITTSRWRWDMPLIQMIDLKKRKKISWAAQEAVVSHSHWGAWKARLALQLVSRNISILKWIGGLRLISNASSCLQACRRSLVLTVLSK